MAEVILGSVVESLTGRVLSFLSGEIGLTCCVKLELKKLQRTLSVIRGVLQDAEKRQVNDEAVKFWLKELKDLAYEADDLLDDFNTEAIRRRSVAGVRKKMVNEVSIFFSSSNQLIYANRMAHRIKYLNEELDVLIKNSERFNLTCIRENPSLMDLNGNRPLTVPCDYEQYVVGRDDDKKRVMDFLLNPNFEENLPILPIVGIGGMGKTTLARLVFKDERLKDHFQRKIWVCVSTNFIVLDILRKILQGCVGESKKGEIAGMEKSGLHDNLRTELGGKKFLLVLDDVWNENKSKWWELQNHLPHGAKGSKMLVTTRSSLVANTMAETSHKLSGLPEKESFTLLMKMAGKEEDERKNRDLEAIAEGILKKCGGVPLAIMTIGRLLSFRFTKREWSDLLDEDFSRIEQEEGDIMPTLKISYDFLPSHLKQCFAYCCLFPKDYKLVPNELDIERDSLGNITECKIHDLMHDLATIVAGDSCTTIINNSLAKEVRHVSMVDTESCNLIELVPNQRIRSLLVIEVGTLSLKALSGDISSLMYLRALRLHSVKIKDISSFRNLRALRLHRLAKGDVLRSIGKLKHLRSLDLSDSDELTSLPNSIGKLLNLETLILYGCVGLTSLPRGVTKLVNLRHLNVEGCGSLAHMPRGIGNLTDLEVLRGFRVEERGKWNAARMNELRRLTGLEELSIESLERLEEESDSISTSDADCFWIDKSRLQSLNLRRCADDPKELSMDLFQSLRRLQSLEITACLHMRSIPPLDQLPSLKSIELTYLRELEWIEVTENKSICLYPSLEIVYLEELPMFKGWKRKRMDVNRSGDQTIHSSSSSLFFIPSFSRKVHVRIYKCEMLSYMRHDKKGVSLQLISIKYKDLEELWRNRRNVEEEETSSISTTQMGTLTFVPLSSVPLHTVTSLRLENLEDTEELSSELFQSLSRLQSLEITECHHIRSIPPLDQLSSLESILLHGLPELEWIEVTENKSICLYPSLEIVYLEELPMFKGWKRKRMDVNRSGDQTIHSSSSFFIPSFSKKVQVQIGGCGMLCYMRDDNEGVLLQLLSIKYKDLEDLWRSRRNVEEESSSISTTQMGSFTLLPLSSVPLHTLTSLNLVNLEDKEHLPSNITDCHRLKSLFGWWILRYLVSLEYLWIENCKELDLSSMDEEEDNKAIQGIPNSQTKMRSLILVGMDKMKTLPPWIQYLPKLETLLLNDCKNMETLPGWFSQLTSLKRLQVVNCGELSRKCRKDTGEWWPRISHIEDVNIQ
ncbi:hypothetical protein SAY86_001032 [Trapa natans]|uniref:Disease resistance protein RGA3 n=1 Tax=Trapa natans TaxID=22666 RepID=A0AAN7MCY6_TRANT|nr:hypothetical protein SAY86_001032 [Trapa natans]